MKKTLIIIFLVLFLQNMFAFNPTFYVGDGVSGIAPQCQNPNYSSIFSAIVDIRNLSLNNPVVVLCEGTYIENVDLSYSNGFALIGENENVIIKSPAQENAPLKAFNAENLILKNLKIEEANLKGILIANSTNVFLEDITISNIKGIADDVQTLSGIHISESIDVNFSGDILIENIDASIKSTNGIEIEHSENIVFDTDSLIIYDIKSNNNQSDSLLTGIKINNSIVEIKSDIIISELTARKNFTGLLIQNESVVTNENSVEIGVTVSNSLSVTKGIEVNNSQLILSPNTTTNLFNLGAFQSQTYAVDLNNSDLCFLGKLELSRILGDTKTYGLNINNSDNFNITKIETDNSQTEGEVRLINVKDSSGGVITKIVNDYENIVLGSTNFKVLTINNSVVDVEEMSVVSTRNLPNCIVVENNSIVNLYKLDLENCNGNYIKNTSSEINIKETENLDISKIQYNQSQESIVKIYKPVNLKFYKDGRDLSLDELYVYNKDAKFTNIFNVGEEFLIDLLYFKKGYSNGILDSSFYNNYYFTGIKSRVNEKQEEITINDFSNQEIYVQFFEMPELFLEQTAKEGQTTKVSNHFAVENKTCSTALSKSYGCFDIKLSLSLEDTENESYTLKFKLPVSWLTQNNLTKEEVVLYHYENGEYAVQKTTPLTVIDNYQIFVSEVGSFSEFQIAKIENQGDTGGNGNNPPATTPPETNPPVTTPPENTPPIDTNPADTDCDLNCLDTQVLDYINCVCLEKPTNQCLLVCDGENEYLDSVLCECVIIESSRCRGVCNVGETMDLNTCTCIPVVLDGMPISQANNFWWFVFGSVIVIIGAITFFVIKLTKRKQKPKGLKKKK